MGPPRPGLHLYKITLYWGQRCSSCLLVTSNLTSGSASDSHTEREKAAMFWLISILSSPSIFSNSSAGLRWCRVTQGRDVWQLVCPPLARSTWRKWGSSVSVTVLAFDMFYILNQGFRGEEKKFPQLLKYFLFQIHHIWHQENGYDLLCFICDVAGHWNSVLPIDQRNIFILEILTGQGTQQTILTF